MRSKYLLIYITCINKSEAFIIIDSLLKKKLAACVNTYPVLSKFTWKGKVRTSNEYILLIKTTSVLYKKVEEEIKKLHSYENPEIIATEIVEGSKDYLNWIDEVTSEVKKA